MSETYHIYDPAVVVTVYGGQFTSDALDALEDGLRELADGERDGLLIEAADAVEPTDDDTDVSIEITYIGEDDE